MTTPKVDSKRAIKTVVLVDNDRLFLEAITELLTASGYAVHTAQDGLEALAVIRQVRPDCIVLDIVMPKLDGGQVCAAVRLDPALRHIPIVVFSGLGPPDFALFPGVSADAYVAKGSLSSATENILKAVQAFEEQGAATTPGPVLGYETFRARQIVKELLLERRHLRAVLRAAAPGAVELDPDGRIILANPRACQLLERRETQLVGELFSALAPPPQQKKLQDLLADLVRSGQPAECQAIFHLGARAFPIRLAPIVEENACTALLVILEGESPAPVEGSGR